MRSLFDRVDVMADDGLDETFPGTESSILTLRTRAGLELTRRNDGPVRGEPEDPMSDAEIEAKFAVMATPFLGEESSGEVIGLIKQLESLVDVNHLTGLFATRA